MKHLIYPCIWYNHNAMEAAEFYCSLFPSSEIKHCTPMVVSFYIKGKQFMGLNGGPMFKPNPSISLFTICETVAEIDQAWEKLSKEGKVMIGLDHYPWSEKYGWVEDKYGVSWQIVPTILGSLMSDPEKAPKVMEAFMKMKKFNIAALEEAAMT